MLPLVSVIVPIYNVENYIVECIDSLIAQTYENFEIILVDDGSTDSSGYIADSYRDKYEMVSVIHTDNFGVSHARNIGIGAANAEFIVFVDSDDYVSNNFLTELMQPVIVDDSDLVVCCYSDDNRVTKVVTENIIQGQLYNDLGKDYYTIMQFTGGPWCKVYRKSIIKRENIFFTEKHSYSEDRMFNDRYYRFVEKYSFVNKSLYFYVNRNRISLGKVLTERNYESAIYELELLKQLVFEREWDKGRLILSDHATSILRNFVWTVESRCFLDFKERAKYLKKVIDGISESSNVKKVIVNFCLEINFYLPIYSYYSIKKIYMEKVQKERASIFVIPKAVIELVKENIRRITECTPPWIDVSVIVPVYNVKPFLAECVSSIIKSSYKNLEIILVDDGSTDGSGLLCDEFAKKDARIKVFHNTNHGVSFARNFAIRQAQGKYILAVDGDDVIKSTYIEKAVQIMEVSPNMGIVYCEAEFFGKRKGKWHLPEFTIGRMLVNNVIFATALFRKDDWKKVGGYAEVMTTGIEDYDFWLSVLELGREVHRIPEILFRYRIREQSRTKSFEASKENILEMYEMIHKRHKELYIRHYDEFTACVRKDALEQNIKLENLKKLIPFYSFITNNTVVKNILKRFIYGG